MTAFDDYRRLMQELDELVSAFELHPDFATRERAVRLLTGLDALHRQGLRRLVETLRDAGAGPAVEQACADPIVEALLTLYDLAPAPRPDRGR